MSFIKEESFKAWQDQTNDWNESSLTRLWNLLTNFTQQSTPTAVWGKNILEKNIWNDVTTDFNLSTLNWNEVKWSKES